MTDQPTNGVDPALYMKRHPGVVALCYFFDYGHLPHDLQLIAMPFASLVEHVLRGNPDDSAELTVALRKILEGKDCAVRAALDRRGG